MDMAKTGMIVAVVVALLSIAFMVSQAGGFGNGAGLAGNILGSAGCNIAAGAANAGASGSGAAGAGNALAGTGNNGAAGAGTAGAGSGSGSGAALAGGSCGAGGGCGCGGGAAAAARNQPSGPAQPAQLNNGVQDVYIKALPTGSYDKPSVQVKAGVPVRFHFSADRNAGCGKLLLINEFGVRLTSYSGEESVAEFTPTSPGTYQYHCGMYMFVGKLVVV
ncbi:Cupredoxin-like domain protein [Candidatus Anstonella stagnisolia]|nr:Cupredoxin-like domain protein [Candidatus Anstonella stagnisolia]